MKHSLALLLFCALPAAAAPYKIGNGDEGLDLESLTLLEKGPIVDARKKAIALLKSRNVSGILGLGTLIPEVQHSELYLVREDLKATLPQDQNSYHSDMRGKVFARTFARPHASTRFFPIARTLNTEQLVALHIHEALHRALPESVREDESKVAELTLAIVSPDSSHDQVLEVAQRLIPQEDRLAVAQAAAAPVSELEATKPEEEDKLPNPSSVGYRITQFAQGEKAGSYPIKRTHSLHSYLYPFGGKNQPFGLGIEAALLQRETGSAMGPLGLSARFRAWTVRDFDILLLGQTSLNMLSAEELKNSPLGRDVYSLGIAMLKERGLIYVENSILYTFEGEATQKLGAIDYTHRFGWVLDVKVRAGANLGPLKAGGFAEVHLGNNYGVASQAFSWNSGRYRLISGGPEVAFKTNLFEARAFARILLDATQEANYDYLGNLLGAGVSQGSVGVSLSFFL